MQANLERLSELERRLSVALPAADIDSEVESRLKRLTRTVKMQGFRPGKVPLKVVAQQYGPQVRQEVLGDAVQKSFGEAVRAAEPAASRAIPRFEREAARRRARRSSSTAPCSRSIPRSQLGDISQARRSTRPQLEVGDAEVDKTIEIMRKQRVHFDPAERAARRTATA